MKKLLRRRVMSQYESILEFLCMGAILALITIGIMAALKGYLAIFWITSICLFGLCVGGVINSSLSKKTYTCEIQLKAGDIFIVKSCVEYLSDIKDQIRLIVTYQSDVGMGVFHYEKCKNDESLEIETRYVVVSNGKYQKISS